MNTIHCFSVIALLACTLNLGAASSGDELLTALQARMKNGGDFTEIYAAIDDLSNDEVSELYKKVDRAWLRLKEKYASNFQRAAKSASGKSSDHRKRVRALRKELAEMKSLADGPMKVALKKRGMPIMDELRTLLVPDPKSVLAISDDALKKERRSLMGVAGMRDALIEAAIIPITEKSVTEIVAIEQEATRSLSSLDRKGLKIMEKNRKTAEKEQVPEPERLGVQDANLMRLLAGYDALEIDPRLCAAGRDHSKDMATLNFFAHESPVAGKKTPSMRAKNFRTSGGGENIYMGSTDPIAANKGWFFSPGHHRNMFNEGYRRIGLGNHDRHWTQMFGR